MLLPSLLEWGAIMSMKPSAYYLRGLLEDLGVERKFIKELIAGVEEEKGLKDFKSTISIYKITCNPHRFRVIINSLIDDLKENLLYW